MQWDTVILGMIAASGALLGGWATLQRNRADAAKEVRVEARDGLQALNVYLEKELDRCRAECARKDELLERFRDMALTATSNLERAAVKAAKVEAGEAATGSGAAL